ncbi:hypothetical protein [Agromyces sp. NPDC049794]|uniref:hypothetical protein n=1 Tax=unclassified Agromyces TaxID=2639701 RepID=UPI0033F78113
MTSEPFATTLGRSSASRLEWMSARGSIAGCVAVVLFATVSVIGWFTSGADAEGLERLAFAAPTVFAIAFAVRVVGTLPFSKPPGVGRTIAADVVVVVAALVFIVIVGSIGDGSGVASYSGIIMGMFLVPATAVASLLSEIVRRIPWLTRVAVIAAIVIGVAVLGVYARALTG